MKPTPLNKRRNMRAASSLPDSGVYYLTGIWIRRILDLVVDQRKSGESCGKAWLLYKMDIVKLGKWRKFIV